MVDLDKARNLILELVDDEKLIARMVDAMAKAGHTWHDMKPGETPNAGQVQGMLANLMVMMMTALKKNPDVDHQRVGCGGFYMYYFRWASTEEIQLLYTPVSITRSIS